MKIHDEFPGAELVKQGLKDLRNKKKTVEAFLVLIGGPRLRNVGIKVPQHRLRHGPELSLYKLLEKTEGENAYSLYNSYLRRLISFEHACEHFFAKES